MRWPWSKKPDDPRAVGRKRSPQWERVQREHIKRNPKCAACGRTILHKLQAHHVVPFHVAPEKELDPENLMTLCVDGPGSTNCHCLIGHCGNWKDFNPTAKADAEHMLAMLAGRVKG